MGDEVYINTDWMGNVEFSDTPQSIGQPKYELRDGMMPGTKEAYEVGTFGINPSFNVETDMLGKKVITPPGGFGYGYGAYSGGYGGTSSPSKPKVATKMDLAGEIFGILVFAFGACIAAGVVAFLFGGFFVDEVGAANKVDAGFEKLYPILFGIICVVALIAIITVSVNYSKNKKKT